MSAIRWPFLVIAVVGACGDNLGGPAEPGLCGDEIDNDGDGLIDYPADPGCDDIFDDDESNDPIAQCGDGRDNDGDGLIDYPNDPGCLNAIQNDEADDCPNGNGCPACANGLDDDGDGAIDYPDDPGCMAAADSSELASNPAACGPGLVVTTLPVGTTAVSLGTGASDLMSPECGGAGDEVGYEILVIDPVVLVAHTDSVMTNVDTILYLRSDCIDPVTELQCNDDLSGQSASSRITASLAPGIYYLVVDAKTAGTGGTAFLDVQFYAGEGEECATTDECGPGLVCRVPLNQVTMVCAQPVCNDGLDDDGDGTPDYPGDPGCQDPADATEEDNCPSGADCPACANDIDDDGDGETDYPDDTDCASASQGIEGCAVEMDPIVSIAGPTTTGDLVGASDDWDLTCDGTSGHLDIVHLLTVPDLATLHLDTQTSPTDTVLALYSECNEPSLACNDDGGGSGTSLLDLVNLDEGTYAVIVSNYSTSFPPGPYTLHVSGTIAPGGRCDGPLVSAGVLTCSTSHTCNGTICVGSQQCNNGVDDDGDGAVGYPDDPGCLTPEDNDESDDCPTGPNCPECGNDIDDDGDGDIDYPADDDCITASTDDEEAPQCGPESDVIVAVVNDPVTGTTVGATDDFTTACDSGTSTPDRVVVVDLPQMMTFHLDMTGSSYDAILAVYSNDCGTELVCDDAFSAGGEVIDMTNLAAGQYGIVIDGWDGLTGNYVINIAGTIVPGGACDGALAQAGVITCPTGYGCVGGTCIGTAQCNNGVDDDGDGFPGYPTDPGCQTPEDADETDDCPSGPMCPECSNDIDDDGDGDIDYPADGDCVAASTPSESLPQCAIESDPVSLITGPTTSGTIVGMTDDWDLTCDGTGGLDLVHFLIVPDLATLHLDTQTSPTDTVLAVYNGCQGTALGCDDEGGGSSTSLLDLTDVPEGTYAIVVGNYSTSFPPGPYVLHVSGTIAQGGRCDGPLVGAGVLTCASPFTCNGAICVGTQECNNGVDDDGDGFVGYPDDPGCVDGVDDDETDDCPAGPTCPECANVADDDGDGLVDYPDDPSCIAASIDSELTCGGDSSPVTPVVIAGYADTTVGAGDDFTPTCATSSTAPELAYSLLLPVPVTRLIVDTIGSSFDTVLSVTGPTCVGSLGCNDQGGVGNTSQVVLTDLPAGEYGILVDGWDTSQGDSVVNFRGTVAPGTACTDVLFMTGVLVCPPSHTCTAGTCQPL